MYRVFDRKEKHWVKEGIYLSPNNDLSTSKNAVFGNVKLSLSSDERYTWHRDIGLYDKDNVLIYEGDIVEANLDEEKKIIALVSYSLEFASYVLLDFKEHKYYTLGMNKCKFIKVIGNVFDNSDLLPKEAYEERSEFSDK